MLISSDLTLEVEVKFTWSPDESESDKADEPQPAEDQVTITTPDELAQVLADETEQMNECLKQLTELIGQTPSRPRNRQEPPPANFQPDRFRPKRPNNS
ncbi:hypothetical protein [Actinomadura rubrobrunea]|uniref:hypothetical protein n=1 Tax=Actinomadura rubrobrunea TaxID=115335 RepID=UPI00082EA077|nr:hypothetical protein [Actinomadura rubrobrunea]